ncbi:hypothetical protein LX36DRAFT_217445 [Colletotrichum falcatum]|nr:hypothetical protein LX36DRAFT_217445 [Colletotrichum falcatum]
MWKRSPAATTDKVPRLPRLCFPEFGLMMEEAGIPATIEGSAPASVRGEGVGVEASSNESLSSKERPPSCLLGSQDKNDSGGWGCSKQLTRDGLEAHRPASDESEGLQMDEEEEEEEEEEAPHGPGRDTPRPSTGLGWYRDDESPVQSTVDHFDSQPSARDSDGSPGSTAAESQHPPAQQDPLRCSPFVRRCSQASSSAEVGDALATRGNEPGEPDPSVSTVVENTSSFLQSSTEDDDDDWLGPRPVGSDSVSHQHVECASAGEEQEIDDLLDIYAAFPGHAPAPHTAAPVQHGDLPPYPPYHPSASAPLLTIARGLSLPPATPFDDLQECLARNANILRYLVLHCVPSPSVNPVEDATDLVEPVLPLPPAPHPSLARGWPPHPRRREYTRLLQAVRSVVWSADAINDMLAVVDSDPPPGSGSGSSSSSGGGRRPSTALPMFRKLRAADARRRGCLTSAQLHRLHRHGVSLLDVLQMRDVPRVVARGLSERLVEAAESGVLEIAKEGNLLDEEGALLELLADPDDAGPTGGPGNEAGAGWPRGASGLRNCVGVDEDEDENGDCRGARAAAGSPVEDGYYAREADDAAYTVSPLSPEADPGERGWEPRDVSPLTASCRPQELEADGATRPDRPRGTLGRTGGMLRTCGDRGGILVDEETARSPEMRRFFHEIGAAAAFGPNAALEGAAETAGLAGEESRLARGGRRSWGVDLGGVLSA